VTTEFFTALPVFRGRILRALNLPDKHTISSFGKDLGHSAAISLVFELQRAILPSCGAIRAIDRPAG
jgi:hypothetical protein